MKYLDFSSMKLKKINHLKINWAIVQHLNLSDNLLSNFKDWPQEIPNLKTLDLSNNQIHTLNHFPIKLPKLQILNIENNQIQSLEGLTLNAVLMKGIFLKNNPIKTFKNIPYIIISGLIPSFTPEILQSFNLERKEYRIIIKVLKHEDNIEDNWRKLEHFYK